MEKRVLVLGGTHFIGLHLVRSLCSKGYQVTVLNRGKNLSLLPKGVAHMKCDRNDAARITDRLKKETAFDAAFDVSGYTPATVGPAVEALNGRVDHYIFTSTGAVYGPQDVPIDVAPITEDFPLYRGLEASSPEELGYVRGKVQCEDLLTDAYTTGGFPVSILRLFYVYGPDNYVRTCEASYFARLDRGRTVIIPGEGFTLFHPVHVDDVASAFVAVLEHPHETRGRSYNVGGPEAITANGYVGTIGQVMGVTPRVVHVAVPRYRSLCETLELFKERPVYPYPLCVSRVYSTERIAKEIGWRPNYHLRTGLEMTYRWWLNRGLDREEWDFSDEDRLLSAMDA